MQTRIVIFALTVLTIAGLFTLTTSVVKNSFIGNWTRIVSTFLFTPKDTVKSFNGRTNILLLGKAGGQFISPDLTDTIIFVSIDLEQPGSISLVSIPRDIWVPHIDDKINASFMKGRISLAKSTAEEVVGQPIHYAFVVDSSSLVDVIDAIGGIEVAVERSFVDEKYPIAGRENDECGGDLEYKCRYERLEFTQGKTQMDGLTALKFSRSRQSTDRAEGTDFARAARQQKVITAIREKLLSSGTLTNIDTLKNLYSIFTKSVETDLEYYQLSYLARKFLQLKGNVKSNVLSVDLLENPPVNNVYRNLYVLIPRGGSWDEVHKWILSVL